MIPLPTKPQIVQKQGNWAIFEIAGLYPGYGITLGNCLRRILLSSLEGSAVTQVKIEGISHEFSIIPGVLEDAMIIILNLKKLSFKNFSNQSQTIQLSIKGEKEVKGKDFKLTSELELANPETHIATITKPSVELKIEALVESGVGYEPAKGREIKKSEIGVIPIDAIFSPMKKVSFKVENMRVGKRTDFDLIRLEIETDGTITPEDALKKSADILIEQFSVVSKIGQEPASRVEDLLAKRPISKTKTAKAIKSKEDVDDLGKIKIDDTKLSERVKSALLANGIKTIAGLAKKSKTSLLEMEGLGGKALSEINKELKKIGAELKE